MGSKHARATPSICMQHTINKVIEYIKSDKMLGKWNVMCCPGDK